VNAPPRANFVVASRHGAFFTTEDTQNPETKGMVSSLP
jgi:hypothetical protein